MNHFPEPRRVRGLLLLTTGATALIAASSPARADVRYTLATSQGSGAASTADMRTTTFIKDRRERVETSMKFGQTAMKTVRLTLCDRKQSMQIDPDLKIYTVEPIDGAPAGAAPQAAAGGTGAAAKPGVGRMVMTYTVKDMGTEKVSDVTARHYLVTMRMQTSGCLGTGDNTYKQEMWVAPIKAGLNCPERTAVSRTSVDAKGCKITYQMKGDVAAMRKIQGGMVVRQKMYSGDKVVMVQELREYSLDRLDAALFAPPADFKKVSVAEFNKARQEAMMKALTGGRGAGGASGGETP